MRRCDVFVAGQVQRHSHSWKGDGVRKHILNLSYTRVKPPDFFESAIDWFQGGPMSAECAKLDTTIPMSIECDSQHFPLQLFPGDACQIYLSAPLCYRHIS